MQIASFYSVNGLQQFCMCQSILAGKSKEKIIDLLSAESAQRVVSYRNQSSIREQEMPKEIT